MPGNCSVKPLESRLWKYGNRKPRDSHTPTTSTTTGLYPQPQRIWGTHPEGKVTQVPASDLATAGITTISVATSTGTASNMLQFAVDSGSSNSLPTATTTTASTSPGETVTYIVSLPAGATFDSVQCLNLPSGSTCSYSGDTLTVTTSSSTPGGAFLFTAVFTETISEASAGLIVLPILLLPLWLFRKNWSTRRLWRSAVLLIAVAASFTALGCGSSNNSNSTPTSQTVTSSVSLTLKVQ